MVNLHYKVVLIISTLMFSLLLVWSCKDESSTEPPAVDKPVIVSFTADPASVPAGGDSVKLTWVVNGATSLSISSGVGSVTPNDSGSVTVFVSASTTFTLTATNSSGNTTADAQVSVAQAITVNGYVKDINGEPVTGATVIIKGKTPTTTGASGNFSVSNVMVPYEIRLIYSGGSVQTAVVYQGLTRTDPTVIYLGVTTNFKSATISGTVPAAVGKYTQVFFVSGDLAWSTAANQNNGTYTINAGWYGSTNSHTGNLYVLRWIPNSNNLPQEYDAYGLEENVPISNGGSFTNHNFLPTDFIDPAEQNITGSITLPSSSYSIKQKSLLLNFGNANINISGESGAGLTANFSYVVPSISATFEIDVQAEVSAIPSSRTAMYRKKGITGGSSGVNITLASAPQLNLPANNGNEIDTTTQFLWTLGGGTGISIVRINPMGQGPAFFIFTGSNNTYIPNLSPQGLGLPAFQPYQWYTLQYYPLSSIDEAASDSFIKFINGHGGEFGVGQSEMFNFTTKQ